MCVGGGGGGGEAVWEDGIDVLMELQLGGWWLVEVGPAPAPLRGHPKVHKGARRLLLDLLIGRRQQ